MTEDETGSRSETLRTDTSGELLARILTVGGERLGRLFAALLFLYFAVLLALTPRYDPDSRLFPLVIGVPTIVLIGALLLVQSSSRIAGLADRVSTSNPFELDEQLTDEGEGGPGETAQYSLLERRKRLVVLSLWMVLLYGLIILIGFLPATFAFLLGFYRFYAGEGWLRALGYAVTVWVVIVLIFDVMMGTRFYEGILGISLPV